jgi:hypothetical protein
VVATACVLVLGGCAEPPAEVAAEPTVSVAPVRSSGPLFDGFEIEPGSGLVGTVFPAVVDGGQGTQALLRIDGDGQSVFDGYVRQAQALGFSVEDSYCCRPEEQVCSDPDDEFQDDEPPAPFVVGCEVQAAHPQEPTLDLRAFLDADGAGHLILRTRVAADLASLPVLPDGPAAPITGVAVAPGLTPEFEEPVRVVEGSALVAEPIPAECGTGGYIAVLQVTGELVPVLRAYQEQFAAEGFSEEGPVGSEAEPRVEGYQAGGGYLTAIGVAGDPSHVLIERCND